LVDLQRQHQQKSREPKAKTILTRLPRISYPQLAGYDSGTAPVFLASAQALTPVPGVARATFSVHMNGKLVTIF